MAPTVANEAPLCVSEPTLDELKAGLADGSVLLIECTGFAVGSELAFSEACNIAAEQATSLPPNCVSAVDERLAWKQGYRPPPPDPSRYLAWLLDKHS